MAVNLAEIEERAMRAVMALSKYVTVVGAYIFGSRVEGRVDKWSDIDIAVFVEGLEQLGIMDEIRICHRIQKEVGDDIETHPFSAQGFTNPELAGFASYISISGRPIEVPTAISN